MHLMKKRYTQDSNLKIIVCSIIIITIGQISYMKSSNVLVIMALVLAALFSSIISNENLLSLMLCVLPANRLLTYGPISAPTVIMLVALFRNFNSLLHIPKQIFAFSSLLIGYSILTIFNEENVFFDSIKVIVLLLFIYKNVDLKDIKVSHYKYTMFCATGCLLSSMIALVINPSSIFESSRFTFSKNGENVLGIICAVMTINLFVLLLEKDMTNKFKIILLTVLLIGIGLMTGSRSFMLALVIGIIGIVIMLMLRLQTGGLLKIITLVFAAFIAAFILIKTSDFVNDYWNSIMYRITKLQSVDVSNGRYEIWKQYFDAFEKNPKYLWFGGLAVGTNGIQLVAHNMIIEQIATYGIVGSAILIPLYLSIFKKIAFESFSKYVWNSYRIIPSFVLLVVSMVSHTLLGVPQTTMLFICFLAILNNSDKKVMEV